VGVRPRGARRRTPHRFGALRRWSRLGTGCRRVNRIQSAIRIAQGSVRRPCAICLLGVRPQHHRTQHHTAADGLIRDNAGSLLARDAAAGLPAIPPLRSRASSLPTITSLRPHWPDQWPVSDLSTHASADKSDMLVALRPPPAVFAPPSLLSGRWLHCLFISTPATGRSPR
jgi:hypothetical protein